MKSLQTDEQTTLTKKAHEHAFKGSEIVFLALRAMFVRPRSIWHINWFASTAGECIVIRKNKSLENLRVGTLGTLNWRGSSYESY